MIEVPVSCRLTRSSASPCSTWPAMSSCTAVMAAWLLVRRKDRAQPDSSTSVYRWLVCPPVEYHWDVIRMVHEALRHAGMTQTSAALRQHFHWTGMTADAHMYVKCCVPCQKRNLVLPPEPAAQEPAIYGPLRHVHIDLAGPFRTTVFRPPVDTSMQPVELHVLLMVDYFTKVAEFAVLHDKTTASTTAAFWQHWICRHG